MSSLSKSLEKLVHNFIPGASSPPAAPFPNAKVVTIDGKEEVNEELNNNHVIVLDQVGATMYFNSTPASLKLSKLTNCKIICGPVHTSISVEYCRNCVLFICGRQVRISNSEFLDMYVRVQSRTTIEDSTNIRFAPYVWNAERSPSMPSLAHFDVTKERFDLIEDFNWLAFSTPSPNWMIIPEDERTEFPEAILPEVEVPTGKPNSYEPMEPEEIQFPGIEEGLNMTGTVFPV